MTKTFIVSTAGGRLAGYLFLIKSLMPYFRNGWGIAVNFQKYEDADFEAAKTETQKLCDSCFLIRTNELTGCHLARVPILDAVHSDIWCLLDDDMFAIEGFTDYDKMATLCCDKPEIGLLSGNWRRTPNLVEKVIPVNKLQKQAVVYTGGGLVFRADIAEIIKSIPREMYIFDNPLWSIFSYVNGYDNARFLGSVAVHNVCTKGGRRRWLEEVETEKEVPPKDLIITKRGKGKKGSNDEWIMCDESCITDFAKYLHEKHKKRGK